MDFNEYSDIMSAPSHYHQHQQKRSSFGSNENKRERKIEKKLNGIDQRKKKKTKNTEKFVIEMKCAIIFNGSKRLW